MSEILLLLSGAVLVNDFLLTRALASPALAGAADKFQTLCGLLLAATAGMALTAFGSALLMRYLLVPADIEFMRVPAFMLIAAAVASLALISYSEHLPGLQATRALLLPLWIGNAAVIGSAALASTTSGIAASLFASVGMALGMGITQLLFFLLRERFTHGDVPTAFRGMPIALCTLGMLSLAFSGFAGFWG